MPGWDEKKAASREEVAYGLPVPRRPKGGSRLGGDFVRVDFVCVDRQRNEVAGSQTAGQAAPR